MKLIRPAITLFILLSVIVGLLYPLVVTGVGQLLFSTQANGSLIKQDDKLVGSILIGQDFTDPRYFWGRLSATNPAYNATASAGSNLGPLNPALSIQVKQRIALLQRYPHPTGLVPVDLVTASASGLDPHISPAAALYQVARVARARGISEETLRQLITANTQARQLGFLGERRVNVLLLNLALDNSEQK